MDRKYGFRWSFFFNLFKLTTFAYLDCSIFLICCSGLVWESFPTNKVSVAILSRLGDFGLRLTGLIHTYIASSIIVRWLLRCNTSLCVTHSMFTECIGSVAYVQKLEEQHFKLLHKITFSPLETVVLVFDMPTFISHESTQ